ncbi:MAG: hypothetical protein WC391_03110 [Methanoregula sp.]|jgi:hypothetical protein
MTDPVLSVSTPLDLPLRIIHGVFGAFLGVAVALALTIVLLPSTAFLAISNELQIFTAVAGSLAFVYAYFRFGRQDCMLYATGAFGLWAASNIVWYVNIMLGKRNDVFPSLIDIGMIASIFLLTVVYQHAFTRKQVRGSVLLSLLAVTFLVPLAIIIAYGINPQTLMTFLYFFGCGSLLIIGLIHSVQDYPLILAGTALFCLAFMIYPLRETLFPTIPVLNVIGTFVSAGFSLMVLGLIPAVSQKNASARDNTLE